MSKFIYQQIKDYLLQIIEDNKNTPHYKLPSENQIALKFNTSRITAKRALVELQEEGYIERYKGKGSFINTEKKTVVQKASTNFICLILPNIHSDFISNIVNGTKEVLKQNGYNLLILSERANDLAQENLVNEIVNLGVKGIIVFPHNSASYNKDLLLLALNNFPIVFVDRSLSHIDVSSVCSDHIEMSKKAVQHLIDRQCKNIGLITVPADYGSSSQRRITGYERAHMENHILVKSSNILYVTKDTPNLKDKIKDFLLANPDLDGLLSYSDTIGLNVYKAIMECGIEVPKQLKVVFFDNEFTAYQDVLPFSSTCVAQRGDEIGKTAAKLLVRYIKNHTINNEKILIDCDIIEHNSTKIL